MWKMALQVVNNQTALGANRSIHQYPPPDLIQNIVPKDVNKQNSQYSTRYTTKSNKNFLFPSVTTILCIFCVYKKILFSNVFILFKENNSTQGSVGSFFTLCKSLNSRKSFVLGELSFARMPSRHYCLKMNRVHSCNWRPELVKCSQWQPCGVVT